MKTFVDYKRSKGIGPGMPYPGEDAWNAAVAACAKEVRAAGCICLSGKRERGEWRWVHSTLSGPGRWELVEHDVCCPHAIAARLEGAL
jgi:hypothetical protein